jgi:Ca2+-binding EF-hand superfamily protein
MNTLTTNFNLSQFRAWFNKIDEDGSGTMSLSEMTRAICEFLKIEEPKDKKSGATQNLPP